MGKEGSVNQAVSNPFGASTPRQEQGLEPLTKPFNKAQADNGTRQRQQGEMDIQPSLETNS
jgi:hypothetical protein